MSYPVSNDPRERCSATTRPGFQCHLLGAVRRVVPTGDLLAAHQGAEQWYCTMHDPLREEERAVHRAATLDRRRSGVLAARKAWALSDELAHRIAACGALGKVPSAELISAYNIAMRKSGRMLDFNGVP